MIIQFLEITVDLAVAGDRVQQVESQLRHHGEPLRWAVTAVDTAAQTAQVEAVITTAD